MKESCSCVYYYLKLQSLSSKVGEIAILSNMLMGRSLKTVMHQLDFSPKQFGRHIESLENKGLILDGKIIARLPPEHYKPYVKIAPENIKRFGIGGALYIDYQMSWNGGSVRQNYDAQKLLGINERSLRRYKKMFQDIGLIKDGRVIKSEDIFTKEENMTEMEIYQNGHSLKNLEKMKKLKALSKSQIVSTFNSLCSLHEYKRVPPPLKLDVIKVWQMQKTFISQGSSITIYGLLEKMIANWKSINRPKPPVPSLRSLPYLYEYLFHMKDAPQVTTIITKSIDAPKKQGKIRDEIKEIDDYNRRMIDAY